jgi:hypothetical protein
MLIAMSTLGWSLIAIVYVVLFISIGVTCIRKGHWVMFILGIPLPLFWIIGALMPPTHEARAAA